MGKSKAYRTDKAEFSSEANIKMLHHWLGTDMQVYLCFQIQVCAYIYRYTHTSVHLAFMLSRVILLNVSIVYGIQVHVYSTEF